MTEESCTEQEDFPPGMAVKMLNLVKSVNETEDYIKPLISKSYHENISQLKAMDRAKIGLAESYAINTLFWVLMKATPEDASEELQNDYKIEMGRLKESQSKLSEVEIRSQRKKVDPQVIKRVINHYIKDAKQDPLEQCSLKDSSESGGRNWYEEGWQ